MKISLLVNEFKTFDYKLIALLAELHEYKSID